MLGRMLMLVYAARVPKVYCASDDEEQEEDEDWNFVTTCVIATKQNVIQHPHRHMYMSWLCNLCSMCMSTAAALTAYMVQSCHPCSVIA